MQKNLTPALPASPTASATWATALALGAGLAAPLAAQAALVTQNINKSIEANSSGQQFVNLDFNGDGVTELVVYGYTSGGLSTFNLKSASNLSFVAPNTNLAYRPSKLGSGVSVDATQAFQLYQNVLANGGSGEWDSDGAGFLGFAFDSPTDGKHYGWLELTRAGTQMTLGRLGYETAANAAALTPGAAQPAANDVPEPDTLALLAAGALGAATVRRRSRRAAVVAAAVAA